MLSKTLENDSEKLIEKENKGVIETRRYNKDEYRESLRLMQIEIRSIFFNLFIVLADVDKFLFDEEVYRLLGEIVLFNKEVISIKNDLEKHRKSAKVLKIVRVYSLADIEKREDAYYNEVLKNFTFLIREKKEENKLLCNRLLQAIACARRDPDLSLFTPHLKERKKLLQKTVTILRKYCNYG